MRAQRKVVTVLFCDLVGSTALGESSDPEALRARMRRYFEDVRKVIERHGGTVEKFVGDAVMAVFGIPTAHEDDALRAVRAASEMRVVVAEHGLEARIGINTGEVVVGGEDETLVTGDAVNVAARLEQVAGSGEILIGARTRRLVRDAVVVETVELLELKGKSEAVEAYRLLDVINHAAPLARRLEAPLVGRERERRRLWRDYEDAVAGRSCRLFTLLGPAGIGKSRLVADFLDRVADTADVLRGRCLPYGEGITYWPLVEMLAPLGIDPEDVVATTPEETRVAFRRLLEERSASRPQLVVVDDLQWAEPVFVDLIEHVADLSRAAPLFLLCVARTELLESRPDWGGGKLNATSLLLEPLAETERVELIENLIGDEPLDDVLRDRIVQTSAGNPLYVEEMLAMVREHGSDNVTVPPTIHALLQARIDALDGDARVVLERGAIEGEVFQRASVAALVPDDVRGELESHLASLVRRELIWPERSRALAEDAYRFRHILVREVVYESMPKARRAELHEWFADWLEGRERESGFELDEILGYHLEQALVFGQELGDRDEVLARRTARRLLAAGYGAVGRADLPAATGLLQRAVDVGSDDAQAQLEAIFMLGRVLVRRGELDQAATQLLAAIEKAQEIEDEGILARARLSYNSLRARVSPDETGEDELARALEILASLEGSDELVALATAFAEVGSCKFQLGRAGEGEVDLERAAEIALALGDRALLYETMAARLRPAGWGPMHATGGIALCEELLSAEYANAALREQSLQILALFHAMLGDVDASRRAAADAWALIEEFDLALARGIYAGDVGMAELLAGDLGRAEQVLRRGHEALVQMGDVGVRSTIDAILGDVVFLTGRHDEALELAQQSRTIASPDDLDSQPRARALQARVLSSRGEHDRAIELISDAVALVEPIDFLDTKGYVHGVLGEVLANAGRVEEAAAALERAHALYEQKGNVVSAERAAGVLQDLLATRGS
jgi:class 3 adenylate cyclase/tetratricopeptide (TPR) repeat protein